MKNLIVIFLIATVCIAATSCKKKSNAGPDYNSLILGHWKLVQMGYDLNANGVLDSGELSDYSPMVGSRSQTYTRDHTMLDSSISYLGIGFAQYKSYQWTLLNENTYLRTASVALGGSYDPHYYHIDSLNSLKLQLFDSSGTTHKWFVYKK